MSIETNFDTLEEVKLHKFGITFYILLFFPNATRQGLRMEEHLTFASAMIYLSAP